MILRYENSKGDAIELTHQKPFIINAFEGFNDLDTDVQTQKSPFQDGGNHIDSLIEPKEIMIEFSIYADDLIDNRRLVSQTINPKISGKLTYLKDGYEREIDVWVDGGPFFPSGDRSQDFQKVTVELIAPNPFWKTPTIEEEPTFEGLFEFPFEGEFEMGIQRDNRIIDNDGDTETPLQIEFYGPAENPRIENVTTGEFIKVNQTLGEDEFMKIDTTPGEKSVVFVNAENGDERNVFNWIDLESTFFQLAIGENEIKYTADNDIQGAEVNIYWQKQFVGV